MMIGRMILRYRLRHESRPREPSSVWIANAGTCRSLGKPELEKFMMRHAKIAAMYEQLDRLGTIRLRLLTSEWDDHSSINFDYYCLVIPAKRDRFILRGGRIAFWVLKWFIADSKVIDFGFGYHARAKMRRALMHGDYL